MTDQSSTGPDGFGDDGLGTDLGSGGLPTADGTDSNEEVEEDAAERGGDAGSSGHGPMVSDAAIDWSAFDGGSAPAGVPTDPEPTDGDAPAP